MSVERFLSEPLSCLLLLFSLLCLAHKKIAWGGIVLALAVLARETALVAALTAAGIWTLQSVFHVKVRLWKAPGPAYWLPGIVTYVFWQLWLQNNWSASPLSLIENKILLGWPLAGFVASMWQLLTDWNIDNSFFLFMMLATLAWIVIVAFMFHGSQGPFRWIWLAYLLVATLLGTAIWNNSPSFLRVTTELNLLGMLVYLLAVRTPHRWVLAAWLGCWVLSAGAEGYRMHLIDQARTSFEINTAS